MMILRASVVSHICNGTFIVEPANVTAAASRTPDERRDI